MDIVTVQIVEQTMGTASGQVQKVTTKNQSGDGSDFGSMVRQKQSETRSQESQSRSQTRSQDGKKTQEAKQGTQESAAGDEKTEVPSEQYVLAAAMMLAPGVQFLEIFTQRDTQEVQTEDHETVRMDAKPEAVQEPAREQEEAAPEREVHVERVQEVQTETFETVVEEVVEHTGPVAEAAAEEEEAEETVQVEVADVEEPLFANVEAEPVKVAEPDAEEPVDLTRSADVERMAARIENLVVNTQGESKVEFTMIPESLGKVSVQILRTQDGALHIQISATTARAAELLGRNTGTLQHLLGADVRPAVTVDVRSAQEQGVQQLLNPDGQQREQQRQQQRRKQEEENKQDAHDFMQQLRLGLVSLQTA